MKRQFQISMLLAFVFPAACGGPQGAGNMTAKEHRAEAAKEENAANGHQASADNWLADYGKPTPSVGHRSMASNHQAHADVHRRAAEKLEADEKLACGAMSADQRQACPLLAEGAVDSIAVGDRGYALRLTGTSDPAMVRSMVDCHLAHAHAAGAPPEDKAICPLFVDGATARVEAHGAAVWLFIDAKDATARAEIGRRLAALGIQASP